MSFTAKIIIVFFVSLLSIALELFFSAILNLKAWNHVVYVIISFAVLGYGIGSNFYLIFREKIDQQLPARILARSLFLLAVVTFLTTLALIYLPVQLENLKHYFSDFNSMLSLIAAYTIIIAPFMIIGFVIAYIFSNHAQESNKLYFWDLLGAGLGAVLFFFLINKFQIVHSIFLFVLLSASLGAVILWSKQKWVAGLILLVGLLIFWKMPEPVHYKVDDTKGLNYIPGVFDESQYDHLVSQWTPLGRTDAFRIKDPTVRQQLYNELPGTFQINLNPRPEYSYFAANYLAGTPIYQLSSDGLEQVGSRITPFSEVMELPYIFTQSPKVVVIGTGGGRDIFMAKTHEAREVVGAEINPGFYREMMPGGKLYDYSGKVYTANGVNVHNIDGRHLVKTLPANTYDLIVLNGVDTYTGLSTGAYAYSESYLYTQNAIRDYLRVLNDKGLINFNRWFFPTTPRETMRLFVIALDALRAEGVKEPWNHIIIGHFEEWGMTLISKKPFDSQDVAKARKYFESHGARLVYPSMDWKSETHQINIFMIYAAAFMQNKGQAVIDDYPFDISVVYDNNPFFYKYYRFKDFDFLKIAMTSHPVTGTIVFMTQVLVLIHASVFILLFIFFPLFLFKRKKVALASLKANVFFVLYFMMLGLGFMFLEIALMQKFTLVLGSPIYSMSVVLAALLISTGIGSFILGYLKNTPPVIIGTVTAGVCALIAMGVFCESSILGQILMFPFAGRVVSVSLLLLPLGICLGMYFPSGLKLISNENKGLIAWAWGINSGFTVLGSILTILLAQFYGFNFILTLAAVVYVLAAIFFRGLSKNIK